MADFSIDISKFIAKAEGRMDLVVRKIGLDLHRGVVHKTPVDTARAKANWHAGINDVPVGTTESTAWQSMYERARRILQKAVAGDVLYITNNVEYILALERGLYSGNGPRTTPDGYSIQAPQGMVAVTLRSYPGIVQKGVREAKQEMP